VKAAFATSHRTTALFAAAILLMVAGAAGALYGTLAERGVQLARVPRSSAREQCFLSSGIKIHADRLRKLWDAAKKHSRTAVGNAKLRSIELGESISHLKTEREYVNHAS
jgi:hypothetical protein